MDEVTGQQTAGSINQTKKTSWFGNVAKNPFIFGVALFSTLGGFLFGYDQGVVSGVLTMESFGAKFPRVYNDSGFKGWFVSTLLLGRKMCVITAVVVFVVGSAIQAGAVNIPMLFAGRAIAGFSVGQLTMVVPLYISEVSLPDIRGGLVVLQQLSITIGILVSYWLDYGTNYIGGTRCAPGIEYTGGTVEKPVFDPYKDVGPNGCDGQSDASWRVPLAFQILPALVLGVGTLFFPDSPRWLFMKDREEEGRKSLATLRQKPIDHPSIETEFLEIKASVILENTFAKEKFANLSGVKLHAAQVGFPQKQIVNSPSHANVLYSTIHFLALGLGSGDLQLDVPLCFSSSSWGAMSSLLATGVYGIINCISTLPALFWIDRLGRRMLLMCGAAGTFISLVIVGAIIGAYGSNFKAHAAAGWVGVVFIYLYDVNFSYSFAPIGWVLPSEIFHLSIRSKAISITTSTTWMCNFIIGLVTPGMLDKIGWGTYIFFAAFCLIAFVFTYLFVPETRGKTLEEMDSVFGDTEAHEEQKRIMQIEASLRGTAIDDSDAVKAKVLEESV
ncbi:MFS monosaccharide transporter, putative [Trichophyton verrucosum HKI 0517]|uniref:MFS monosaccharide transporter, putative n=1 Tax=Trichophyton verrucosum (strain HKI 0517) TaxID=663202 RepID=D4D547_TRIVH|nr:MFS monosaccharide transporter, putative [Trichophyton verrucosum HKI 0517]EFE43024.1 MFS monosaccharide transporter, putative [Trichophyton verrucosum HKI 0517]